MAGSKGILYCRDAVSRLHVCTCPYKACVRTWPSESKVKRVIVVCVSVDVCARDLSWALRLLLSHQADVSQADPYATTPLHMAAAAGSLAYVHLMGEFNTQQALKASQHRDRSGRTPIDIAMVGYKQSFLAPCGLCVCACMH